MAPGNTKEEVEFTFEACRAGVEQFLLKYSAPTSLSPIAKPMDKFHTVISLNSGSEGERVFNELLREKSWEGNYTIVTDQNNEHFDAMSASDFGLIYDGQMIGSAAVCHLPTMILLNMRMHQQYYHDMYNRWWNDMNIIANNNIYPEVIGGEVWFGRITDQLGEWYLKPRDRYRMIQQWEYFIKEALPRADDRQPGSIMFGEIQYSDGQEYEEFLDPHYLSAVQIWQDI